MRKWVGALTLVWLLWNDLTIIGKDKPLDTIVLRWLARVPRFETDHILAGSYGSSDECRAALERQLATVNAINDSWAGAASEGDGDSATIHYPRRIVYARAQLSCVEQP